MTWRGPSNSKYKAKATFQSRAVKFGLYGYYNMLRANMLADVPVGRMKPSRKAPFINVGDAQEADFAKFSERPIAVFDLMTEFLQRSQPNRSFELVKKRLNPSSIWPANLRRNEPRSQS